MNRVARFQKYLRWSGICFQCGYVECSAEFRSGEVYEGFLNKLRIVHNLKQWDFTMWQIASCESFSFHGSCGTS